MNLDYIVSSLPALSFAEKPAVTMEQFASACGGECPEMPREWIDLDTQIRNTIAECRARADDARPHGGCSIYWRERVRECFAEADTFRRDEMLDKVWWDAAGELTKPAEPLGKGALFTYAIRLKIALRRALISSAEGSMAFTKLTDIAAQAHTGGQNEISGEQQ